VSAGDWLMRSKYADYFNHDADAAGYDQDVQNERDPIRAGYRAVLRWVADKVKPHSRVPDLGQVIRSSHWPRVAESQQQTSRLG
jgi:hypothetical protein